VETLQGAFVARALAVAPGSRQREILWIEPVPKIARCAGELESGAASRCENLCAGLSTVFWTRPRSAVGPRVLELTADDRDQVVRRSDTRR